ncbi:MAG TPA: glutathione S-transferase [Rhodocyclaceae bacterium]|nr:glutathione S-transferase [Rhodocyclaceae bacterium]HUY03110.1 glutathione S-transferase [Rhodocyclaceae bacterium]
MLKLCGFSVSNYYNKVKLSLLEKGIAFEEETIYPSQDETLKKDSPMGKVPFLRTAHGVLSESQVLTEYLEDTHREPPLYPADPFRRAKCRELIEHIELHIELPARRLYPEAFFGGSGSDETKAEVEKLLGKGLKSLAHLARFEPFIAGAEFTHADCAAIVHLPLVSQATKKIYGRDLVDELLPAARPYLKAVGERPAVQRVNAERKTAMEAFIASKSKR